MDVEHFFNNYLNGNRYCSVNGMKHFIEEKGVVRVEMQTIDSHVSGIDTKSNVEMIHGAVMTSLLDSALGAAALTYSVDQDNLCATTEIKTSFFLPVSLGDYLIATGKIKHAGNRILYAEGDVIRKADGKTVASAMNRH